MALVRSATVAKLAGVKVVLASLRLRTAFSRATALVGLGAVYFVSHYLKVIPLPEEVIKDLLLSV